MSTHHTLLRRSDLLVVCVTDVELPYYASIDWVIDVDLSAVSQAPKKYWVLIGDVLTEATVEQKAQADAAELDAAKLCKNDLLWTEADAVNAKYVQGGALILANELFKLDNEAGTAVTAWVRDLWADYYTRKSQIYASTTLAEVCAVSADFSTHEPMPYSVGELMYWAEALGVV